MEGAGCWCSDGQGKPIPNTTTRHGKPKCLKKGKTNIRRSPLRNVNRNKRGCSRADQVQFNTNLIKIFYIDHTRYHQNQQHNNQQNVGSSVTDKVVLDWKFSMLDTNRNHLLDKIEYRALKRMVKKVLCFSFLIFYERSMLIFELLLQAIKPKRCARTFGKYCDIDVDDRLSRQEWANCLSKDVVNREFINLIIQVVNTHVHTPCSR